jgi:hypothetical protein
MQFAHSHAPSTAIPRQETLYSVVPTRRP